MNIIFIALIAMGGLGLFFAAVLAIASEKLKVKEDPRIEELMEALPGLNCGACAQAGCHDFAEKVAASGSLEGFRCPPGGAEVEERMAEILGVEASAEIKKRAVVKCGGGKSLATERAEYDGIKNCTAAELVAGGSKACTYGCLGYGDCKIACPFDAITMSADGLPVVDEVKCTACGLCVEACPRNIIEMLPCSNRILVACNSKDKGAVVRKVCKVGCIACQICVKQAPRGYVIDDFLARVVYDNGDEAAEAGLVKCPTKCIIKQ